MQSGQHPLARCFVVCALVTALAIVLGTTPAHAGGVVGDGTPGTCTEAAFDAALALGGDVTFDCGTEPYSIPFTSQKSITLATTIDGGGNIIFDGQNLYRLFDTSADLALRNLTLTRGYVHDDGGAIRNGSTGTLILENSTIRDSVADLNGGAIASTGPLTITNSVLENNQALNGGALFSHFAGASTIIIKSVLHGNHAIDTTASQGGAILALDDAPVTIVGSEIANNTARSGGGIYYRGNAVLTLQSSTWVHNNQATESGGGIYNFKSTVVLTNSTLSGNSAVFYGGGMETSGVATLTNSTLSGNAAAAAGGGLRNLGLGTATLTNVTLSGNATGGHGGGLGSFDASTTLLTNVTVVGNSGGLGGGLGRFSGSVIVERSIVANNLSGGNCSNLVASQTANSFNLSNDASCDGFTSVPDLMIGPLADNGGPTQTHMLLPDSPAIDSVTTGCPPPAADQRGAPRTVGACDTGAVEYGALLPRLYVPTVQ